VESKNTDSIGRESIVWGVGVKGGGAVPSNGESVKDRNAVKKQPWTREKNKNDPNESVGEQCQKRISGGNRSGEAYLDRPSKIH